MNANTKSIASRASKITPTGTAGHPVAIRTRLHQRGDRSTRTLRLLARRTDRSRENENISRTPPIPVSSATTSPVVM